MTAETELPKVTEVVGKGVPFPGVTVMLSCWVPVVTGGLVPRAVMVRVSLVAKVSSQRQGHQLTAKVDHGVLHRVCGSGTTRRGERNGIAAGSLVKDDRCARSAGNGGLQDQGREVRAEVGYGGAGDRVGRVRPAVDRAAVSVEPEVPTVTVFEDAEALLTDVLTREVKGAHRARRRSCQSQSRPCRRH